MRLHQCLSLLTPIFVEKLAGNRFGEKAYLDAMTVEFDKTTKKRYKGTSDSYVRFSNMANDKDVKVGIKGGQIKLTK